ncbi:hypothetical protein ERJ99_031260, partial [Pseudomonas aeruginosa]
MSAWWQRSATWWRSVTAATLESGGYSPSWLVDGVYPGDEAFDAFRETLDARGWKVWVHSNR